MLLSESFHGAAAVRFDASSEIARNTYIERSVPRRFVDANGVPAFAGTTERALLR